MILSGDCTNCGRCIDICAENVFQFGLRYERSDLNEAQQKVSSRITTRPRREEQKELQQAAE